MKFRSLSLAGAAVVLTALSAAFVSTAMAANSVRCMTDDGHGRFRPCSALYKKQNPNWRESNTCMTDDGYGRYRPCDSPYKSRERPHCEVC